jgi:hypothetical protein
MSDENQLNQLRELVLKLADRIYICSTLLSKCAERKPRNVCDGTPKPQCENEMASCKIEGVGPDAPTITNAAGGKQSASPYRCDLIPSTVILALGKILAEGARKYGDENWRNIRFADHINHALVHIAAYRAGDRSDDHLGHALCRMVFAFETAEPDEEPTPGEFGNLLKDDETDEYEPVRPTEQVGSVVWFEPVRITEEVGVQP